MKNLGWILFVMILMGGCASVENQRVEVSSETNAIVVSESEEPEEKSEPFACERVYRVVVAHTYALNQNLTGPDGELVLGAQTVAETLLRLSAGDREEKPWNRGHSDQEPDHEVGAASLGVVAAALAFVEAESKRKAREREPMTLYSDEKQLLKIRHCLDIARVSSSDAEASARNVGRHAREVIRVGR